MSLNNTISLEKYSSAEIPMQDWNITDVFHDVIMCKFVDVPEDGDGDFIMRGGVAIPLDVTRHTWRVVEVLRRGIKTCDEIQVGDLLMIPNDRGISCVQKQDGKKEKFIFINEDRVFCKVEKRD